MTPDPSALRPYNIDRLMLNLRLAVNKAGYVFPSLRLHESAEFCEAVILFYDLRNASAGNHSGKPITFQDAFELTFGRPLHEPA